jgi:hypothetical protein
MDYNASRFIHCSRVQSRHALAGFLPCDRYGSVAQQHPDARVLSEQLDRAAITFLPQPTA